MPTRTVPYAASWSYSPIKMYKDFARHVIKLTRPKRVSLLKDCKQRDRVIKTLNRYDSLIRRRRRP